MPPVADALEVQDLSMLENVTYPRVMALWMRSTPTVYPKKREFA